MDLTLNVLRCPDAAVPESRRSSGGDLAIGRGHDCEWQLQDPERVLSKRHCLLEFRGGFWQVRDLSTNGTFLNHAAEPVGRDLVAPLKDGDRLRLGSYEIEVRIAAAPAQGMAAGGWGAALPPGPAGMGRPAPDPFADPFAPLPASPPGAGSVLPDDFDPFGDEPPMPDHQPAASDAFVPPRAAPVAQLPDDWGLDFDIAAPSPAAPPAARPQGWTPVPAAALTEPSPFAPPPAATPQGWDPAPAAPPTEPSPFASPPAATPQAWAPDPVAPPAAPSPFAPPPQAWAPAPAAPPVPSPPIAPPPVTDPFAEEGVPSLTVPGTPSPPPVTAVPAVAAPLPVPPSAVPEAAEAVTILLRAAGLSPGALPGADPAAVLEAAGASLRAAIAGIRALLIARADVKREFRIEQTMLRAAGNNPLKFAATDEAALTALLSGKPGAVEETVGDLNAHQVASLAATQAAARALLDRLAPAGLEAAEKGGGFLGGREKRLWEAYKALHARVTEQFEDDFDSAFGKEFARAYEQASRKEPGPGT